MLIVIFATEHENVSEEMNHHDVPHCLALYVMKVNRNITNFILKYLFMVAAENDSTGLFPIDLLEINFAGLRDPSCLHSLERSSTLELDICIANSLTFWPS